MIYDAEGKPLQPTLAEITMAFGRDLEQIGKILQVLQNSIMLVEMKANFVINQLQEKGMLGDDLDKLWAEFVKREQEKYNKEDDEVVEITPRDSDLNVEL